MSQLPIQITPHQVVDLHIRVGRPFRPSMARTAASADLYREIRTKTTSTVHLGHAKHLEDLAIQWHSETVSKWVVASAFVAIECGLAIMSACGNTTGSATIEQVELLLLDDRGVKPQFRTPFRETTKGWNYLLAGADRYLRDGRNAFGLAPALYRFPDYRQRMRQLRMNADALCAIGQKVWS